MRKQSENENSGRLLSYLTAEAILQRRSGVNYWWVFQGKYFEKQNRDGRDGYIEAPQSGRDGARLPFHWENVREVKKGDYILAYVDGDIRAIGIALGSPVVTHESPYSGKQRLGWQVQVSWTNLDRPFCARDVWDTTKHLFEGRKYMPLNCNGDGNQGYLYQIDREIFVTYLNYIKQSCHTDLSKFVV